MLLSFTLTIEGLLVGLFTYVVYYGFLHPLAKYPGPLLCKFTNIPQGYHAVLGDRFHWFLSLHKKYGSAVRVGPNLLSFDTAPALKTIYSVNENVQKSDNYLVLRLYGKRANIHNTIDKSKHAFKHRVLAQALSNSSLRSMQDVILGRIHFFVEQLGKTRSKSDDFATVRDTKQGEWGSVHDLSQWCYYLTVDIFGKLCFDADLKMLKSTELHYILGMIRYFNKRNALAFAVPLVHWLKLDAIFLAPLLKAHRKYRDYCFSLVNRRVEAGDKSDARDFYHFLINACDPETGRKFTLEELWNESTMLMVAGSDTTAFALSVTMFHLLNHPSFLAKATSEVRGAFSSLDEIKMGPQLSGLHYIRACIDETLRLTPPATAFVPREVLGAGIKVEGHHVPAGVVVGVTAYPLHHNPKYYPDPESYQPSRWLVEEGTSEEAVQLAKSAFCPFSIGPRQCIAKNMAYAELSLTLSCILFTYDVRWEPGQKAVGTSPDATYKFSEWIASYGGTLPVQFRQRTDLAAVGTSVGKVA